MTYKDYEGYTKPYVIVHNTGFGVMEAPYEEHEVVGEADTYQEAFKLSEKLRSENNTPEEIQSGWVPNTYHININTLSLDSKPIVDAFNKEADEAYQRFKDNPDNYTTHTFNGRTFIFQKLPEFDDDES